MKVTVKDFPECWDSIKGYCADATQKGWVTMKQVIPMYDSNPAVKPIVDQWISAVNKAIADVPESKKKWKRNYSKTYGGKKYKGRRTVKKSTPAAPAAAEKPAKTPKASSKKNTAAPKGVNGDNPHWHRILKKFVKMAGTTKDVWRVQEYMRDIQGSCAKGLGRKTPFIDIIREIQEKISKFCKSSEKKVNIPEYKELVEKCKAAFKEAGIGMSKKVDIDYKEMALSGCSSSIEDCYYVEGKKKKKHR